MTIESNESIASGTIISFTFSIALKNLNEQQPLDTLLVDVISICSVPESDIRSGQKNVHNILSLIANNRNLSDKNINAYSNSIFYEEILLNEQTFYLVYQQGGFSREIFYNFERGIVAFKDANDILWTLVD